MPISLSQPELQRATLALYGELLCRRSHWGGELVFAAFEGAASTGISAAASLAGAASLIAEGDTAAVHANNRDGAFDFVVNTLDEALRALKNEIRRGRALSVALTGDAGAAVAAEAAERGLAPRLVLTDARVSLPTGLLAADGVVVLPNGTGASAELGAWLGERGWLERAVPSISGGQPGQVSFAETLGEGDVRRRWLRDLTKYQRSARGGDRWCWLTEAEARSAGI